MNKTKRSFLGLLSISILLSGCWGRTELNELAITSATAVDRDNNRWRVSYQVIVPATFTSGANPGGGGADQTPVFVYSTSGKTLKEATSLTYLEAPRRIFFGHNSIVVVSEKTAREGLGQIIDLYLRNPDSRESVSVMITTGRARDALEQLMNIELISGQGIRQMIEKQSENLSKIPNIRMFDLAIGLLGESKSGLIPEVVVSGGKEVNSLDQLKKTSLPSKIKFLRVAVIHNDKLVGWLTRDESLGVGFLTNKVRSTTIAFSSENKHSSMMDSSFLLTSSSTKLSPKKKEGRFQMMVNIKAKGMLYETNASLDLMKPEVIKRLEQQLQKEITKKVEASWESVKSLNTDVVGFYDIIKRKYPKEWNTLKKDKDQVLKQIDVKVHVNVSIKRVGLSQKSYKKMKED